MARAECHVLLLIAAVLLGVAVYLSSNISSCARPVSMVGFSSRSLQYVQVQGNGIRKPGLYAFHGKPTAYEALQRAGWVPTDTPIPSSLLASRVSSTIVFVGKKNTEGTPVKLLPMTEAQRYLLGLPMRLNTATDQDLRLIPGIGPSLAKTIIRARKETGRFMHKTDLNTLTGLNDAKYEQIAEYLTVGN